MTKSLYITATGPQSGKSAVALGVMQLLGSHKSKVAIFRPIIADPDLDGKDPDLRLLIEYFKLEEVNIKKEFTDIYWK